MRCMCVGGWEGSRTHICGCKHPSEHPAGTRAIPSLSAYLCRDKAAAPSTTSTLTSLSLTHKELNATHVHRQLSLGLLQREVHRHSPDTKATFSFRMGRTSEAFKPSFRKEPVGQQNRRNQGKRGQMAESLGPTFSFPTLSQARKLCLVQAIQPSPEQERVHNGKSTST